MGVHQIDNSIKVNTRNGTHAKAANPALIQSFSKSAAHTPRGQSDFGFV